MRVVIQAWTEAIIWRRIDGILQHSSVNRQRWNIHQASAAEFSARALGPVFSPWLEFTGRFQTFVCQGKCLLKIWQRRASGSLAPLVPVFTPGILGSDSQFVDVWSVFCGRLADLSTNGEICVAYLQSWRCKWPGGSFHLSGKMISCIFFYHAQHGWHFSQSDSLIPISLFFHFYTSCIDTCTFSFSSLPFSPALPLSSSSPTSAWQQGSLSF